MLKQNKSLHRSLEASSATNLIMSNGSADSVRHTIIGKAKNIETMQAKLKEYFDPQESLVTEEIRYPSPEVGHFTCLNFSNQNLS